MVILTKESKKLICCWSVNSCLKLIDMLVNKESYLVNIGLNLISYVEIYLLSNSKSKYYFSLCFWKELIAIHTVYFWREMLNKKHPFKCTYIWTSIIKRLWRGKKIFKVTLKLQRYFVIYIRSPLKMQKIIKQTSPSR